MLVLNTNLYYDQNKLTLDMDDPAGQFSWADRVLTDAANNKEKAKHLACQFKQLNRARVWTHTCHHSSFSVRLKHELYCKHAS